MGGLPRVAELFEVRKPKDMAVVSEIAGTVSFAGEAKGKRKLIVTPEVGESKEYLVPKGKHITVSDGDFVECGDLLTADSELHDILRTKGEKYLAAYLVDEIQEVYRFQGVGIDDKHIEVIVRQMLRKVTVTEPGGTSFLVGEQVDKAEFKDVTISYTDADGNAKERSGHQVSVGYVAKQLKDAGIIKYKGLFELYCSVSHAKTKIDPGTYELSTNYDYRALVKKMQVGSGAMVTTKVTIPEGYTMEQIFRKLEDENVCSYDDLMDAAANYSYNYSFIDQSMQGDAKRLEGFLFPDTYEFYQGMQASSAINKFLENFHDRITAEMLEKADERGMTMQEVVTVASMIEKEAANDDERAMIAAVIYNRIEAGMPLQIDSTIMYVLPEHKDVLTVEDTKIDSPYNTYQNKGLPPTPIANPGLASIKAALSPASTQALYYALDAESGTHKFFTNYGEFQAFVAKQSYSQ